jgi:type I restriction enzyme S subunit
VPELRFPGYEKYWEKKKINEISTITSGGTPNRSNFNYWNGEIPWITTSLIDFKTIETANEYITKKGLENSSAKLFPKGTILMAMYGQGKTRGKVGILGIEAATNQACAAISLNRKQSVIFIFYSLANLYEKIRNIANDGGQKNLSAGIIKSISINVPHLSEQTKIASFLTSVDKRITLLQKKKTQLEQYKKGAMQQLFSQQIRFRDKDGKDFPDWEEKTLGEVLTIGSGKDYKHLNTGLYPVYGTGGQMTFVDDYLYDGESVGIGRKGTIDKPVYLKGRFWTVDTLFYTHTFINVLPYFIYLIFQQIVWYKYNEASGVPSLSKSTLEKIKVRIPHKNEQKKIASFLSSIDKKIEKTGQQIEAMQEWKKGLLQKMFV